MSIVIKGVQTGEDAALCVAHGMDALVVSNHGGHAAEDARGTAEALPEDVDWRTNTNNVDALAHIAIDDYSRLAYAEAGLVPSMGSIGDCYDNAMIEAFWSRMQVELLDTRR